MTHKDKSDLMVKNTGLPKSLWRFYTSGVTRGYYGIILVWALMGLVFAFDRVLYPMSQKWIVQIFETPALPGQSFFMHALPTVLLIVGLNLCLTLAGLMRGWARSRYVPQVSRKMSEKLTDYVHRQSMSFWTGRMSGQVHSQMGQIADGFFVIGPLWNNVTRLATIFVNTALLFTANYYVGFVFLGIVAFRILFVWKVRKPMKDATKHRSTVISKLSGKIVDSISNYSIVKLFARSKGEERYLEPTRTERVDATMRVGYWERIFIWIPDAIWGICFGVTIMLCAYLYSIGQITIANVILVVGIYVGVINTVAAVIDSVPDIIDKLSSASRAYEELVVPIEVADAPDAAPLTVTRGGIEIKNLSFKYRRKKVLDKLSLTIKPGEKVGLVGTSGAGKTTLVNLLMRFYDPMSGEILIDGQNIKNVTQDSLRENIAFIPQEPAMFNRTLAENIGYGKIGATKAEIKRAAKRASADEFIMGTDKKYDSMVGDRGIKLSGGQRQRIAIARAFLKDAPILILDEATSALDSQTEVAIQKSFDELARGKTTIAIAHRLSTLRNMDRIVVLDKGKIIEQGTHSQLLRRGGEYARLWKMQSGGFIQE